MRSGPLPFALVVALFGCEPSANDSPSRLSAEQQQQRIAACFDSHRLLTARGVIAHGGASPGVDPEVWSGLTGEDKTLVIEVAACIQSGGQPGEQEILVQRAGGLGELERRRTPNRLHLP
jgi:hypothetical protein